MIENEIGKILTGKGLRIATAESCTGGLLSSKLTDVSGSSLYIHLNFVTYSNEAKQKILGVKSETLEKYGAVSEECAYEMASGLYNVTEADICVSTTGIAGPTGGTDKKPIGLMYSTVYTPKKYKTYKILLSSDITRIKMKEAFTQEVLKNILDFIKEY